MQITQEVRDYASRQGLDARAALDKGLAEKASEFIGGGAALYHRA